MRPLESLLSVEAMSVLDHLINETRENSWHPVYPAQVHKSRPSAVLLSSWTEVTPTSFLVRTVPISHSPDAGYPFDIVTGAEMLRQAVITISHAGFGVDATAAFVMKGLSLRLCRRAEAPPPRAMPVTLALDCHDIRIKSGGLRAMRVGLTFCDDAGVIATGEGDLALLTREAYRRLRGNAAPCTYRSPGVRVPASAVGRCDDSDVVLSPVGSGLWSLAVDTSHPGHFDHPMDHVPGMVLIEAAAQAHGAHHPGIPVTDLLAGFYRYAEIDRPISVRLTEEGRQGSTVRFHQDGAEVASVQVGVAAAVGDAHPASGLADVADVHAGLALA